MKTLHWLQARVKTVFLQNITYIAQLNTPPNSFAVRPAENVQEIIESSEEKFSCQSCGKMFKSENILKSHYRTVHERANRVTCVKCGQTFSNKYILRKHGIKKHPPKVDIS